ncbi:MAG: NmrA family NAD(P)-binding protein [Acidobacteriota bacterium]
MFTVFGAHGNTGSIVATRLLEAGKQVRAVARDARKLEPLRGKGAEVLAGDVTDAAFVTKALAGAEGAWLLLPPDNASSDLVARNRKLVGHYTAGLRANKVPHAAFLSSVGAQVPSGTGPIQTTHIAETELPASGTTLTFVRAAYFMENILANAYPMKQDGVLPVFGGGETYAFPMVATRDIGEVAAEALLAPAKQTQWIELSGPKEYSMVDAADEASKILGKPVKAVALPIEQVVPTFTQFGFSANVAGLYREMIEGFAKGIVRFEGKPARRGKVTLAEVLRAGLA